MKKVLIGLIITLAASLSAAEHEVKMLNFGDGGSMIFEPGFLKVNKGDTINFKSVDLAHNSEINENISVTLNEEGLYVYQCTPHLILGMIGVIQVGEAVNLNEVKANVGKLTFAGNPERLSNYLNLVE